jgi:hypothetical protein
MNHAYKVAGLLIALSLPVATQATGASIRYTSAGTPDLSEFVVGKTTFEQVQAVMGDPVELQTDSAGMPRSVAFLLPLQGERTVSDSVGVKAVKSGFFSTIRSHAGSLVSHIPGIGGMVAAEAMDAGSAQALKKVTGAGAKVWLCSVKFQHRHYSGGSCSTMPRPI